jgi:hypothetical protein
MQEAVKPDPDPDWGAVRQNRMVVPPGSDLTAFLFPTPAVVLRTLARGPRVPARKQSSTRYVFD